MKNKFGFTIILILVLFSSIFADKVPPMSEGTANGVINYTRSGKSEKYVLDFQKSKSSWGHMCSCHVGISTSTTSGKTSFFYMKGDENTFFISFKDDSGYESDFELDKTVYSLEKINDGDGICLILKSLKRIKMKKRGDDNDFIFMEPGSVIVYYFKKDYESYFQ